MTEEERFGLHLTRWLTGFIIAAILIFSFATENDMIYFYQNSKTLKDKTFCGESYLTTGCGVSSLAFCATNLAAYNQDCVVDDIIYNYERTHKAAISSGKIGMSSDYPEEIAEMLGLYIYEFSVNKYTTTIKNTIDDGGFILVMLNKNVDGLTGDYYHYVVIYSYIEKSDVIKYVIFNPAGKGLPISRLTEKNIMNDVRHCWVVKIK